MITFFNYFFFLLVFIMLGVAILEFLFWAIEKSLDYLTEYFFPAPELPKTVLYAVEHESYDLIWNMHKTEEPDMRDYHEALKYLYKKKYAEYFGLKI